MYEPYITDFTMNIHNKIYQNYVNNLNDLHNYIDNVINIDKFDIKKRGNILFNSGGVLNHQLFYSYSLDRKTFRF